MRFVTFRRAAAANLPPTCLGSLVLVVFTLALLVSCVTQPELHLGFWFSESCSLSAIMKRPVHRIVDTHITPGNASVALF